MGIQKLKLTKEDLAAEYEFLGTQEAIAKKYNVSEQTVFNNMKKLGIVASKTKHVVNHDIFKQDTERSFYLAGFIAADGCLSKSKKYETYRLCIGLSRKDRSHLELIKSLFETNYDIRDITTKLSAKTIELHPSWTVIKYASDLRIVSKSIFDDLKRFNVVSAKSLSLSFPNWLIIHPLSNHFLRGYFDGDGSFGTCKDLANTKYLSIAGTYGFLEKYQSILVNQTGVNITKLHKHHNIHYIKYGGNNVITSIVRFLYKDATIYLDRKRDIIKHLL